MGLLQAHFPRESFQSISRLQYSIPSNKKINSGWYINIYRYAMSLFLLMLSTQTGQAKNRHLPKVAVWRLLSVQAHSRRRRLSTAPVEIPVSSGRGTLFTVEMSAVFVDVSQCLLMFVADDDEESDVYIYIYRYTYIYIYLYAFGADGFIVE